MVVKSCGDTGEILFVASCGDNGDTLFLAFDSRILVADVSSCDWGLFMATTSQTCQCSSHLFRCFLEGDQPDKSPRSDGANRAFHNGDTNYGTAVPHSCGSGMGKCSRHVFEI